MKQESSFFEGQDPELLESYRALTRALILHLKDVVACHDPRYVAEAPATEEEKRASLDGALGIIRDIERDKFDDSKFKF